MKSPTLSPFDKAKIVEMEAEAWRSISTILSVVEATTMKVRETNIQLLLTEANKHKKRISTFIDKCKDFYGDGAL